MLRIRRLFRSVLGKVVPRRFLQISGPTSSRAIALTFDDGPDPIQTPRLLDSLSRAKVVATFFVIGELVERHPEIVARIVAEGHAIGTHSYTHPRPKSIDAECLVKETQRTNVLLMSIMGRPATMFRPPYGKITAMEMIQLWRAGQSIVLWNVDPKDFACKTADEVRENLSRRSLRAGDILLFHDNQPYAADIIADLAQEARRLGLTFTTPDAWGRPRS